MPQLDDLLPVLNPATHTLGMVFILHCKAAAVPLSNLQAVNTFLSQCRTVLLGGDPEQIRTIPKEFVAVRRLPPRRDGHACRAYHTDGSALANPTSAANTRGRPPPRPHPPPLPPERADHDCRPTPSALDDPRLPPQVCNKFSAAAIAIKSPLVAVRPLMAAAAALQPGPTHFTPLHAECLKAPPHTHAHAACPHMHHAHSSSRRGSASLVPPIPRPCLVAPRPPPRPTTPVPLSSPDSSLTRPPARPPAHRSASSPRPTPPPCRCCSSPCSRRAAALAWPTLGAPVPRTPLMPRSRPAP